MKIIVTGSLGNIGKPLAIELIKKGHEVGIISSKVGRQNEIEAIGAKAAIGTMQDVDFLTKTFTGADIVYCMESLDSDPIMHDPNFTFADISSAIDKIVNNYKQAISRSGVTRVIHLSSIGAHANEGTGFLLFHHHAENILRSLPNNVSIKFMRPVGFYYNLFHFVPLIKMMSKGFLGAFMALRNYGLLGLLGGKRGVILSNYGGKTVNPMVSPLDIASAIAQEMDKPFEGRTVRYIASEELSCDEIAKILGGSIGKPYLKWGIISDKQLINAMVGMKMNPGIAKAFVEMNNAAKSGKLYEDYYRHRPLLGGTKLQAFATEFAEVYNK